MAILFLRNKTILHRFVTWILPVLVGLFLALIDGKRNWVGGFAGYAILLLGSTLTLEYACRLLKVDKKVKLLGFGIFWLHILIGVGLMALLPVLGYQDSEVSQAGYLYQDAYIRDQQAWDLASSSQPLRVAFSGKFSGDQYGGFLWLSSLAYRFISPGYHRPLLVLIWVALACALAVIILWRSVLDWLSDSRLDANLVAWIAAIILAFYPEVILLGSSHMRETIVILGAVLMFRGFVLLVRAGGRWVLWLIAGGSLVLGFQSPLGVAHLVVLCGLWLLEPKQKINWKIVLVFGLLIMLTAASSFLVFASLPSLSGAGPAQIFQAWLTHNFIFQAHLSERSSGMLQKLLDSSNGRLVMPIVIGYGAVQPVLPAALVDSAAPIWRVINVLRALGWYCLAPLLVYGTISVVNPVFSERKLQRLWLGLVSLGWVLIAAANAGGDQWDNPRYRTLFIPWMAVLAAWVWVLARRYKDPWLSRFFVISGLFSLAFLEWYLSRYFPGLIHLDIRIMIVITFCIIGGYLLGCLFWDYRRRKRNP